jgi:hypothetical protein
MAQAVGRVATPTRAKPLQGRKKFDLEFLSPLKGLLNFIYCLIPRLAPQAINLPPLTGLQELGSFLNRTRVDLQL